MVAFHLIGSGHDCGDRIGGSHAEIIVAMNADDGFFDVRCMLPQ